MNSTNALLHAALCVLLWSFIAVVSRLGQQGMDGFQLLFWSNILSAGSVLGAAVIAGKPMRDMLIVPRHTVLHFAVLGALDCLFYVLLYRGYAIENGVAVLVVQYSWPLLMVVLATVVFRERLHRMQAAGMLVGFAAVAVTLTQGHFDRLAVAHPQALFLVFVGALCFALLSVLSRSFAVDAYTGSFWLFVSSTLASTVLMLVFSRFVWPPAAALPATLVNGILINGLSYILWIKALAAGRAATMASLVFLAPILSILWLVLLFHEPFVPAYVAGVVLAVTSGVLCTRKGAAS